MNDIVLASASIGRKKLFQKYFENFKVSVSNIDESKIRITDPMELVKRLAFLKAAAVSKFYHDDYVCGFDTLVLCEGQVVGKPKCKEEAREFLRFLSGKEQSVVSGYAIMNHDRGLDVSGFEETRLHFKKLSEDFISDYIENHPVTKFAGGYAVQDNDHFIDVLEGDHENIIGAPMFRVVALLEEWGIYKAVGKAG